MLENLDKISPLPIELISFLRSLTLNDNVNKLIVFGSRAFGDHEQYSDLDLAIDAPNMTSFDWLKLKEYVNYDLRTVIRISIVNYANNPSQLKERINQTGKIIYAS